LKILENLFERTDLKLNLFKICSLISACFPPYYNHFGLRWWWQYISTLFLHKLGLKIENFEIFKKIIKIKKTKKKNLSDSDQIISASPHPDLFGVLHLAVSIRLGMNTFELIPSGLMEGDEKGSG